MNGSISDTNRSADALWAAVARLVGAEYDLAGELSATTDGRRTAYIATRRTPERELVLLVVERGPEPDAYELSLHEVLDESVPARDLYCRHCGNRLETWAAACPVCHQNTALATAIPRGQVSDLSLRSAVASALGADSTPLGQLPTASGSIAVFARAARTGEIVALTLERIGGSTGPTRAVPIVRLQRHNTPTSTVCRGNVRTGGRGSIDGAERAQAAVVAAQRRDRAVARARPLARNDVAIVRRARRALAHVPALRLAVRSRRAILPGRWGRAARDPAAG